MAHSRRKTRDLSNEEHDRAAAEHMRIASSLPEGPTKQAHLSAAHCHAMACKSPTWAAAADCMSRRARTMGGDQAPPKPPGSPPAPKPPTPTVPTPATPSPPSPTSVVKSATSAVNKVAGLGEAVSKDSRTYDFLPG